jgi:hypothetical protein
MILTKLQTYLELFLNLVQTQFNLAKLFSKISISNCVLVICHTQYILLRAFITQGLLNGFPFKVLPLVQSISNIFLAA